MRRLACIEVRAFPLQLLLRNHPDWGAFPVAVLSEDRAQGRLCFVNRLAYKTGVRVGQTHAQALSIAHNLHAGVVSEEVQEEALLAIVRTIEGFSPEVERNCTELGVFWCNATGLDRLFKSLSEWGRALRSEIGTLGYRSSIVVGYRRFGSYALARTQALGFRITKSMAEEERATKAILLEDLDFDSKLKASMQKLGVVTLGEFGTLPAEALGARFGTSAYEFHGLASGTSWDPLQAESVAQAFTAEVALEPPAKNSTRIIFAIKRALDEMLSRLATQHRAVQVLFVEFAFDHSKLRKLEVIRPAEATLESRLLLSLLQMRLESCPPQAAVADVFLRVTDILANHEQLSLFAASPKRSLRAANEALARIRADLGNEAIVIAELRDGHLPEARFTWTPLRALNPSAPQGDGDRSLVRRIYKRARILSAEVRYDPYHLVLSELTPSCGEIANCIGPHIIAGGWWNRQIHRDYYYLENRSGDLLWVYYDQVRNRWALQGRVE